MRARARDASKLDRVECVPGLVVFRAHEVRDAPPRWPGLDPSQAPSRSTAPTLRVERISPHHAPVERLDPACSPNQRRAVHQHYRPSMGVTRLRRATRLNSVRRFSPSTPRVPSPMLQFCATLLEPGLQVVSQRNRVVATILPSAWRRKPKRLQIRTNRLVGRTFGTVLLRLSSSLASRNPEVRQVYRSANGSEDHSEART